ncbi:hypothetical protein Agub_g14995, partial [Astrephomene gubernaculifera]
KFWALVTYLQQFRDRETLHGIIFVTTRRAVLHLADMMRRTQQLAFLEVLEAWGCSAAAHRRDRPAPGRRRRDRQDKGMKGNEQTEVIGHFAAKGRKVLVATSAPEE